MKSLCALIFLCILDRSSLAAQPNVLHILADDMGWNALSCYGNKDVATPNLDRLAAEGMRFTTAYADAQCSPTRAAFLSGQYGARTGVFKVLNEKEPSRAPMQSPAANDALAPEVATLATTLRKAGYATGISGKWHIANNASVAPLRKRDGGGYFDTYGFDFAGPANGAEHHEDKTVTAITDDIIHFMEMNKDRPWFAFVSHFSPHTPLEAPEALIAKHVARGYQRAATNEGRSTERPIANYLAMLEHFDNQVGRLLEKLDELGLRERTVVVFTSDNGGLSRVTKNAPLREGKGAPYEGGIRVPLIVRWPGKVKAESTSDAPVHAVDFYPTYAALAGATPPAKHGLDGESLMPLLEQSGALQRTALHWHMPTYTTNFGRTPCAVIREGDWKLIHWFGDYLDTTGFTPDDKPYGKLVIGPRTELYNVREDISEAHDLAAERPQKAAHLTQALNAWLERTGARRPTQNPGFDEKRWWTTAEENKKAGGD
ncbi:sulfatase [Prosthecobacter sp.]|uniref:sulfatase n=1 Tax=Prosthecobacter sp. TaxID=1965333 RepID=UPI003784746E